MLNKSSIQKVGLSFLIFWLLYSMYVASGSKSGSGIRKAFRFWFRNGKNLRLRFDIPEDVSHVVCVGGEGVLRSQDLLRDGVQHWLDGQRGEVSVDHNTIHLWIWKEEIIRTMIIKKEKYHAIRRRTRIIFLQTESNMLKIRYLTDPTKSFP